MTWRYAAYSLAHELGYANVDAMLEGMSALQFQEWLAFYKIRESLRKEEPGRREQPPQGAGRAEMQRKIMKAFRGWERRNAGSDYRS